MLAKHCLTLTVLALLLAGCSTYDTLKWEYRSAKPLEADEGPRVVYIFAKPPGPTQAFLDAHNVDHLGDAVINWPYNSEGVKKFGAYKGADVVIVYEPIKFDGFPGETDKAVTVRLLKHRTSEEAQAVDL